MKQLETAFILQRAVAQEDDKDTQRAILAVLALNFRWNEFYNALRKRCSDHESNFVSEVEKFLPSQTFMR